MFGVPSWGDSAGQDYDYGFEVDASRNSGSASGGQSAKKRKSDATGALEAIASLIQGNSIDAGKRKEKVTEAATGVNQEGRKKIKGKKDRKDEIEKKIEPHNGMQKVKKSKNKFKPNSLTMEESVSGPSAMAVGSSIQIDVPPKKNKNKFKTAPADDPKGAMEIKGLSADSGLTSKVHKQEEVGTKVPNKSVGRSGGILSTAGQFSKGKGKSGLLEQMRAKLQGGQFRWLNETMYTQHGDESFQMMQNEPELFQKYHEGFRQQTHGWPKLPVDIAIKWLKGRKATEIVADFGCGDAKIAKEVKQKVHSLDLVSTQPDVIACDMAKTPLEDVSVDVAVFCLALMGTDYPSFLREAYRVLKPDGKLWVAEVRSRFASEGGATEIQGLQKFVAALKQLGFTLCNKDASNRMFVILELNKQSNRNCAGAISAPKWPPLKACTYKRR